MFGISSTPYKGQSLRPSRRARADRRLMALVERHRHYLIDIARCHHLFAALASLASLASRAGLASRAALGATTSRQDLGDHTLVVGGQRDVDAFVLVDVGELLGFQAALDGI